MINRKEALNSKANILSVKAKQTTCWYCHLHGVNILDKNGCCKRCKTNITKWSKRGELIYPGLNSEQLSQEVLGSREKFIAEPEEGHTTDATPQYERLSGHVNHCKICGQKTLIFIWSTSRVIDKEKLAKLDAFKYVINLDRLASPVCWACAKENTLIVSTEEVKNEARTI